MNQSELYVVATPLGNKGDITLRAMECLREAKWIFAEDTRETLKLLELCAIPAAGKRLHSYANHNLKKATAIAVEKLQAGESIVLVTDRGTPGVSDPGALLVAAAREAGVKIVPVPGASAVTALVSVSGSKESGFVFWGFFPRESKAQQELSKRIQGMGLPVCFYESARRIRETAGILKEAFPTGRILIGREMTKHFEQLEWFDLADLDLGRLPEQGEYTFLLEPGEFDALPDWAEQVRWRAASDRDWSKFVAERHGTTAKEVYNALQKLKSDHASRE